MASALEGIQSYFGYTNCEVPSPQEASKEEPIVFDELENPVLLEQARKYPLRPPCFENLLQPLRQATMVEPLEGLRVDFGIGISQRMQVSSSWLLPHGQGGSYDLTLMYAGGKMANPYDFVSPNPPGASQSGPGQTGRQDDLQDKRAHRGQTHRQLPLQRPPRVTRAARSGLHRPRLHRRREIRPRRRVLVAELHPVAHQEPRVRRRGHWTAKAQTNGGTQLWGQVYLRDYSVLCPVFADARDGTYRKLH